MKDTVRVMVESDFGFDTTISLKNRELFEEATIISEEVRYLTTFTPEKVVVLKDGNNVYIEFANNLERLMQDTGCDIKEAVESVMISCKQMASDANIILDESCIERVDIDALIEAVGSDHVFKK